MKRVELTRKTKETDITVSVSLDGTESPEIDTGLGFFDHMLTALSLHSGIRMNISCKGDLHVDCHHTVEDVGIVLGKALDELLGDRTGIARYGSIFIPMDEALCFAVADISGRPYLVFDGAFSAQNIGGMDTQTVEEFFRAFAANAGITLHLNLLYGKNDHHKAEAIFKACAHALKAALSPAADGSVLSTKGVL